MDAVSVEIQEMHREDATADATREDAMGRRNGLTQRARTQRGRTQRGEAGDADPREKWEE